MTLWSNKERCLSQYINFFLAKEIAYTIHCLDIYLKLNKTIKSLNFTVKMKAIIEIIELKSGTVINSLNIDSNRGTIQIANVPDQCPENEAKFEHRLSLIHEHGVRKHIESAFTKIYLQDGKNIIF